MVSGGAFFGRPDAPVDTPAIAFYQIANISGTAIAGQIGDLDYSDAGGREGGLSLARGPAGGLGQRSAGGLGRRRTTGLGWSTRSGTGAAGEKPQSEADEE